MHYHIETPTVYSYPLSQASGQNIWLKMECYQPSLSFKVRGIGRLCHHYQQQGYRQLVASSGGNAGYSAAFVAQQLGLPICVYVPSNTHPLYVHKIRRLGAQVIVAGQVWDEAHQVALKAAADQQAAYIPPFDHPLIWAGNSTLMDEVVDQMPKPDAIVVAVGGGGLAIGVLEGLQRHGWTDVAVWGVETHGAASLAASLAAAKRLELPRIDTIATTLGTKQVSQHLLDLSPHYLLKPIQVSDGQAVRACQRFLNDHQLLVEPACGAALATVYERLPALACYSSVLVIVCGGVGIDIELLHHYAQLLPNGG